MAESLARKIARVQVTNALVFVVMYLIDPSTTVAVAGGWYGALLIILVACAIKQTWERRHDAD